ncbi:MAG: hypothetical protein CMI62_05265 [Parvibaculum sp.]|jgi:hypothetical protein|uniref:DUF2147 domain-containing protein n=1 Tax=Parvibaculum sp. TaxID=2024848 RepID=UPI000C59CF0B|nr:DUF2147 domain-containing protein [Parvibaculum sp.]MAU60125.1 hypothetical protein [Parvibaculum sp.]|tara:strand:+ start:6826 stop:7299 length:474 start_codon:yes stop_codon:yes gene_type:complete
MTLAPNTRRLSRGLAALAAAALLALPALTASPASAASGSAEGKWLIHHPASGEPLMIVEIEEENGALEGHIVKLADGPEDAICWSCTGENRNKPLAGMKFLSGFRPDAQGWSGGFLLRPATGTISPARLGLVDGGKALQMTTGRGPLRVDQKWERID